MTPIQDHARILRQHVIHGDESPKRHYKRLIKMGLSEVDAANMSGWHPMVEFDTWFGRATVSIAIAVVVFMLVVLTNSANAMVNLRDDVKEMKTNETAFTRCLNGEPILMEDRWFKCDCVVMRDGKKCPEVPHAVR